MSTKLLERFLNYVKVDTQSDENSTQYPSTKKQFDLAKILAEELKSLGLEDAKVDKNCYVTATLKGNSEKCSKTVGFIAHMDTATNASGANVKPQVIENYNGGTISFSGNSDISLSPEDTPYLKKCIGDTIVTSDGTTLLGGDDKAGIAVIITAIDYLLQHPEIEHGDIRIGFTPDEEVGQGTKYFDIKSFGADFAFTVDGHMPGLINKETFSADLATVEIKGKDIHPGEAKDVMVNSIRAASEIISRLPKKVSPECTSGYEPFIHPYEFSGSIESSKINILFRSFKRDELIEFKKSLEQIIEEVQKEYPKAGIALSIKEQYRNMSEYIDDNRIFDCLWKSVEDAGLKPEWEPIRGGTDGSILSEKGLPTPNIFAGCANCHSPKEYVSLNAMSKAVEVVVNIAKNTVSF